MRPLLPWLPVFVLLCSCNRDEPEPGLPTDDGDLPALEHPFFDEHEFPELSVWSGRVEGPVADRPDAHLRGDFAIGNGRAFAFLGLTDPVNTLHSAIGPVYARGDYFFGDIAFELEIDGEVPETQTEWVARPRGTGLVITRADADELSLYTVDFGPHPSDLAEAPPALVRFVLVTSRASEPHAVRVVIRPHRMPAVEDGRLVELIDAGVRRLAYLPWQGELIEETQGPAIDLGVVLPWGNAQSSVVLATGYDAAQIETVATAMSDSDADTWLDDTLKYWSDWSARGLQLHTSDPELDDLYDGMRVAVRLQQSAHGGVSPMSEYTGVWLRDTIGPVRFYLRAGLADEARSAIDYLHLCHIDRGDFGNSCSSGLTPEEVGAEPDWDALAPFAGKTAAEGPSYVPLMYRELVHWTGDWDRVAARWPYLKRALLAQNLDVEGRQAWSGDETFRAAMGVALGYPIEYGWPELSWSANSSFLMLAAAEFMTEAAAEVGTPEEEAAFADLADRAQNALDEHFLQADGWYAPFIFHSAGSSNAADEIAAHPFEDVNLKGLWSGALDPSEATALSDLRALEAHAGRGDGTVRSPIDSEVADLFQLGLDLDLSEGFGTGMTPGYYLFALTQAGDPGAEAAFDALPRYADQAGQFPENMLYSDFAPMQVIYDPSGLLGDYTARYRPWEGGIDLDAVLAYLLGVKPIEGGIFLRPHLPARLDRLEASGIVVGDAALHVVVTRVGEEIQLEVSSAAAAPFSLRIELPCGEPEAIALPGGETVCSFDDVQLGPGEERDWVVRGQ